MRLEKHLACSRNKRVAVGGVECTGGNGKDDVEPGTDQRPVSEIKFRFFHKYTGKSTKSFNQA